MKRQDNGNKGSVPTTFTHELHNHIQVDKHEHEQYEELEFDNIQIPIATEVPVTIENANTVQVVQINKSQQ